MVHASHEPSSSRSRATSSKGLNAPPPHSYRKSRRSIRENRKPKATLWLEPSVDVPFERPLEFSRKEKKLTGSSHAVSATAEARTTPHTDVDIHLDSYVVAIPHEDEVIRPWCDTMKSNT